MHICPEELLLVLSGTGYMWFVVALIRKFVNILKQLG